MSQGPLGSVSMAQGYQIILKNLSSTVEPLLCTTKSTVKTVRSPHSGALNCTAMPLPHVLPCGSYRTYLTWMVGFLLPFKYTTSAYRSVVISLPISQTSLLNPAQVLICVLLFLFSSSPCHPFAPSYQLLTFSLFPFSVPARSAHHAEQR